MVPTDWDLQDWLIIVEALGQWTSPPGDCSTAREERAWELIGEIGMYHSACPSELVEQIDDDWDGRCEDCG